MFQWGIGPPYWLYPFNPPFLFPPLFFLLLLKRKKEKEKGQGKSLRHGSSKVKNSHTLCRYFYLAALASPPLLPISLLWLLIQLPAGTNNGLYSKSKETFSRVQTWEVMLMQEHPSPAKNFSDCSDKVALIYCSCSINQIWLGAGHCCWVMQSGLQWRKVVAPAVICFSHSLHFIYSSSFGAIRQRGREAVAFTGKPDIWGLN